MTKSIWITKLFCKVCGDIIQSKHRHDYVTCSCGSCSIDGGTDYVKVSWAQGQKPEDCYELITEKIKGRVRSKQEIEDSKLAMWESIFGTNIFDVKSIIKGKKKAK